MLDINEGKRLLVVALNAGLGAAKLDEWRIFEEGHELHDMFNEDEIFEEYRGAVVVAEAKESQYGILIVPVIKQYKEETILGTHTADRVMFDIYLPEYDAGDWSVGMEAYWIIDPDEMDPETAESPFNAAKDAVMWIVSERVGVIMDNELEADYWRKDRELTEELELTEQKKIS